METLDTFVNSVNENADGRPQADYMNEVRGFRCRDEVQTVNPKTGNRDIKACCSNKL